MDISAIVVWIMNHKEAVLGVATAVYTLLSLIVKVCPTLDEGWILNVIKFLALITNRQTDDSGARQAKKQVGK